MTVSDVLDGYTYPWLTMALAGALAVAVALVVHSLAFAALRRLTKFSVTASTLVEYAGAPARTVLPLFALQVVLGGAPEDLRFLGLAQKLLALFLIGVLTWLGIRIAAGLAEAVIRLHPSDTGDNLHARQVQTQTRVLARTAMFFIILIGAASALMTFPAMRQIGTSLLASAGVAGLVAGIAARPVLGNLISGLQIALSQPIRLDDVVIIEGEWGRIEEITSTYVVVKIWDERRLVVPLQWVIEHPFQNWTRTGSELLGTVLLWVDYRVPLAPLRAELERVCGSDPDWDGRVVGLQVVEASERGIQLRALVSAADAPKAWDLRCRVREALIGFLQLEYPEALPRLRAEIDHGDERPPGHGDEEARSGMTPPQRTDVRRDVALTRGWKAPPGEQAPRAAADARDETTGKGG